MSRLYSYECKDCNHCWTLEFKSISAHIESDKAGIKCPICNSQNTFHNISNYSCFRFHVPGASGKS